MKFLVTKTSDRGAIDPQEKEIATIEDLYEWLAVLGEKVILYAEKHADGELCGTIAAEIYDEQRE